MIYRLLSWLWLQPVAYSPRKLCLELKIPLNVSTLKDGVSKVGEGLIRRHERCCSHSGISQNGRLDWRPSAGYPAHRPSVPRMLCGLLVKAAVLCTSILTFLFQFRSDSSKPSTIFLSRISKGIKQSEGMWELHQMAASGCIINRHGVGSHIGISKDTNHTVKESCHCNFRAWEFYSNQILGYQVCRWNCC